MQISRLFQIVYLPLERTFTGDFEEYLAVPEGAPKEIHIVVAIK